jgi:tripartite-type tricarboxylate transporter receptor subunit TctC
MAGETSENVMFARRSFLIGAALAPLASAPAHAQASGAQVWPARPVMLIIPFPAGGAMDLLGRGVAQELADKLGQQFVVDNRAARWQYGAMAAAKASPDGYTILMAGAASLALNKFMFSNMPYDPETELTPIVILSRLPHIFVVNAKVEAKTLKELVDYAKANPGKLSAGVPGVGTTAHITL